MRSRKRGRQLASDLPGQLAGRRAAAAIALAVTLFIAGSATRPWVEFGPRQKVVTTNAKMGVHTRLTDEVEPWKIQRTLQMVREMGAPWMVEYFLWASHEPAPGVYDWSHADLVVDHAVNQGLTVIARLGYVPDWARPARTSYLYLDEAGYGDFARFAAAFATHFRGRVGYLIVWNEPNLSQEWGYRPPDPKGYTELVRQTYVAVKAVAPEVKILAGALAPTLAPPGSEWGLNDLDYLQGMYDAGAARYFDILSAHSYGWTFAPDEPPAPDVVNFRRVELLRKIMVRNGDGAKSVMLTEGGWNDHPRWTKAVRPAQRAAYTVEGYEMVLRKWPWAEALCIWAFRYPAPAATYQDNFTLVGVDFEPKPIYDVVRQYALTGAMQSVSSGR